MKKIILSLLLGLFVSTAFTQTVHITKTGKKYHVENCRYLSRSSFSISLTDAKERGYDDCSVCRPPTVISKTSAQKTESTNPVRNVKAVQCSGTTQKGARCKRTTKNTNGRCWQHGG